MPRPKLYYVRHGETDWNAERRLQGRRDIPLNARGRSQATHCGMTLRELFQRDNSAAADFDYVSSPLVRARETMELMRAALGLDPAGYAVDDRLAEISFGSWEGLTLAQIRQRAAAALAAREHDKWRFVPPGGESYAEVSERIGAWYAGLGRDAVIAAHGGVARGLIAHLGIMPVDEAPLADIEHGVVYAFARARMARYA